MSFIPLPAELEIKNDIGNPLPVSNTNIDVLLSSRLKPADTLAGVSLVGTVSTITNPVSVSNLDVLLSTRLKPADTLAGVTTVGTVNTVTSITNSVAITAAALPLPTGASTETTLSALNTKVVTTANGIKVDGSAVTQPSSVVSGGNVVDTQNSSTTPLTNGGVFTGVWVNSLNYSQIEVMVFADQNSATNGLQVQFSSDGTNIDHTHPYYVAANIGATVQVQNHAKFYRIVYTNGTTPQSILRLQTILRPISSVGTVLELIDAPTRYDDAVLTKSVITGYDSTTSSYVDVKTTPDGGLAINQNTKVDTLNSSTSNLAAGATFTGTGVIDLNYTAVQYLLKTDQNCVVYVDQSPDGTNWDLTDTFEYFSSLGGDGKSVQLIGTYYRIRVTNIGTNTTTYFRLQVITVPFLEPLPRSLDEEGYLQVGVKSVKDSSGFSADFSPFGEALAVPIVRLVGSTFGGPGLDANFWNTSVGTNGTITEGGGQLTLSTGTTANNSVTVQTVYLARFIAGRPNKSRFSVQLADTGTTNNTRRWGAFTTTDGCFFEISGTTFRLVTRKGGVDTQVNNGTFNGEYGSSFTVDTNAHTYEILYVPGTVYFYIGGNLIHTVTATTTPWSSTYHLPIRFENTNSNSSTSNVTMYSRAGFTGGLGLPLSQAVGKYLAGAQTTTLKNTLGNLHGININDKAGTSIIIYDSTTGSGTIIANINPSTFQGFLDFKGIIFTNGLTVVGTGAINCTVMYE